MKFCPECGFLLYYIENENDGLMNHCNNCGYDKKSEESIISTNVYIKDTMTDIKDKKMYVYDNTYPHTIHYKCPNKICETNKDKKLRDAIFFPDKKSLQLIYICCICKTEWK